MLRGKANTSLNPSNFFIKLNVTTKIKAADTYNLLIFQDHVKKGYSLFSTQHKNVGTK